MFKKPKHDTISNLLESNLDYLVHFAYFGVDNHVEAEGLVHDTILRFLEIKNNKI